MRLKYQINPVLTDDSDGKDVLFKLDSSKLRTIDGFTRYNAGRFQVAAASTEAMTFGDVTAVRGFYLRVYGDALVTINGADTAFALTLPADQTYAELSGDLTITSISIENEDAAAVLPGILVVWGDPAA